MLSGYVMGVINRMSNELLVLLFESGFLFNEFINRGNLYHVFSMVFILQVCSHRSEKWDGSQSDFFSDRELHIFS